MSTAIGGSTAIVGYFALFAGIGLIFVFVNLLIGRFLRPSDPHEEKLEIYECGEPAIGSSFVQFDLRFYVVALIFIIFDVEVAFLFPWATVFGKANQLLQADLPVATTNADGVTTLSPEVHGLYREMGLETSNAPLAEEAVRQGGRDLLKLATLEVLVFFAILLIAFAYEWKIGALDWVRALTEEFKERTSGVPPPSTGDRRGEPVLSA